MRYFLCFCVCFILFGFGVSPTGLTAARAEGPVLDKYLQSGDLVAGEKAIQQRIDDDPNDQVAVFELGVLRFMQAIEKFGQSMYRFGATESLRQFPFMRFPVPANDDPQSVTYDQARALFAELERDLASASETLAQINDNDIKLPLHLMRFHLDFDGNGIINDADSLKAVYELYLEGGRRRIRDAEDNPQALDDLVVVFDYADVHWLRGYCELLRGLCKFTLAYQQDEMWHVVAHRIFPKAEVKFAFLNEEEPEDERRPLFRFAPLADFIAGIHNFRWKVDDPQKMSEARDHLLEMISESRLMWKAIENESDNDREWIPGPGQKSAMTPFTMTDEMLVAFKSFLDEGEKLLKGDLLVPFWRGTNPRLGVNLERVFNQPKDFDLVLWVHGSGAAPFLEEGEVTSRETWEGFQRIFRGNFVGFAIWVN